MGRRSRWSTPTVVVVNLRRRISDRHGEFLLFAVTPPRKSTSPQRVEEIADATMARLRPLGLDGLVLYDIDDESDRNAEQRPFPFVSTLDPADYLARYLTTWTAPAVIYRVVGKYPEAELRPWLDAQDPEQVLSVFVGASSRDKEVAMSLKQAHALRAQASPELAVGGVAIPERHTRSGDEHLRLLAKQDAGCRFFITQVVYDVNAAKNVVSDYRLECIARGVDPVPIVFTFTVVGSTKTLEFLSWLGVEVPRWIQNDLIHSDDVLTTSYDQSLSCALDLITYCRRLGVPFGLNIESVSSRRAEIEQAVQLAARLGQELHRPRR